MVSGLCPLTHYLLVKAKTYCIFITWYFWTDQPPTQSYLEIFLYYSKLTQMEQLTIAQVCPSQTCLRLTRFFPLFLSQTIHIFYPNSANLLKSTVPYIYIPIFFLNSLKCWFRSLQTEQIWAISSGILQFAPNECYQYFKDSRRKIGMYRKGTVLPRGLPCLDRKYNSFVTKKVKNSQCLFPTDYNIGKSCVPLTVWHSEGFVQIFSMTAYM